MRAALIPPKGYEQTALRSNMHLVLPMPKLRANPMYVDTYRIAHKRGDYIILDNGCAEGQLVDGNVLVHFAERIGAHEIVAPDVMDDTEATFEATTKFLADYPPAADYGIMAVVQGKELADRTRLVDRFAGIDEITTLGIPKAHVLRMGSAMRLRLVEWILSRHPDRFKLHLLGLSSFYPNELRDIKFPSEVRSYDSALPYKATEDGLRLNGPYILWCKRRQNYFTHGRPIPLDLLEENIGTFMDWGKPRES